MPIRFRCTYCNRLLGIATRKAGTQTRCPHCGYEITVPVPAEAAAGTERAAEDPEPLFGRAAPEVMSEQAVAVAPAARPVETGRPAPPRPANGPTSRPAPSPPPSVPHEPTRPDDRPLFEGDIDEIFGDAARPAEPAPARPPAPDGVDARSLGEPARHIVMSARTATLLMAAVVILMALSFAAGYFVAPKG
jgi:phage FluMu protein Com